MIETGEELERHDEPSPTRSAVMVRLSHGHIRIGSFQRLRYLDDAEGIEMLMRHTVRHHFSEQLDADMPTNELAPLFLSHVASRIADTAGSWLAAGFVHGVLNTDNFNVTGESFDYGPWRFLPNFDPQFVAAYFDHAGRYAYGRQAEASLWAVCRLADCLTSFGGTAPLEAALQDFYPKLEDALQRQLCWRLGISASPEQGQQLVKHLFTAAKTSQTDYAQILHDWYGGTRRRGSYVGPAWEAFAESLGGATPLPQAAHAAFDRDRPEDLQIGTVEALWKPIAESDEWDPLYDKVESIRRWGAILRGEPD